MIRAEDDKSVRATNDATNLVLESPNQLPRTKARALLQLLLCPWRDTGAALGAIKKRKQC